MTSKKKRKMINKKAISLLLSVLLIFTLCGQSIVFASSQTQIQGELDDVKDAQDEVGKKMAQVEKDVKELQSKVDGLNYKISKTTEEIESISAKIEKKEKEMQNQENNLNKRLRVMYKSGSVGFIDILLGSGSISEFVSNIEIVKKIYQNDVDVLKTLKKEHAALEKVKSELKSKRADLAVQKKELANEKASLDKKKKELEKDEDALKAEADKLTEKLKSLIDTSKPYSGGVFQWPCPSSRYITSSYGNRLHPVLKVWKFHTGIDIGASSGNDITAAAAGKVIMSTYYGGYGNCVMIDHGGGIVTLYGHASRLLVGQGEKVVKGQTIAKVGSTGRSTGPHLHFEVRKNGAYVNPMSYFG